MQIVVIGAGAIGSLYGAKLGEKNDVILIGREDHVHAIKQHGLRIEGIETKTVPVRAATGLEKLAPDTLILLTTKVPATAAALQSFESMIGDDTTIIALQNGLNSDQITREAVHGRGVVLRGITQFGATFDRPGVIRYLARGYTVIEDHPRSRRIAEVLNAAGLDCRSSSEIKKEVWRKVIFNCVVNPITTILGSEVGEIVDPSLHRLKQMVIDECLAVAAADGVPLDGDFLSEIDAAYRGSHNIVSMRQDILRGRPTEIDYLNGAVAALGNKHGLSCPVNAGLTSIIKGMELCSGPVYSPNFSPGPPRARQE